nr:putative retrotransposon protein [Tanacetum cinerariifolium]
FGSSKGSWDYRPSYSSLHSTTQWCVEEEKQNPTGYENSLIDQEASGSLEDLEIIQEEDTHPSLDTSLNHEEDDLEIDEPQSDIVPIRRLKQASKQWNKRFDDEIKKFGFTKNRDEPCVYIKASGSNITFLILYVDDILIMGNSIPMLQSVKTYLGKCFAMKDLGEAAYILEIKIYRDRSKQLIGLCQSAYIEKILKQYCMKNSKRRSIPMQEKRKLSKSQVYGGDLKRELRVSWYTDAGYLTDADDLKSQTGYVFILNGGVVDWKSAKQSIFATSSAEAEYTATFNASKEVV